MTGQEWPSMMTGAGADRLLAAINAGCVPPRLVTATERMLHLVADTPPCDEEPDPSPVPAELLALDELVATLETLIRRLGDTQFAMQLAHDDGEPFTDQQRAAAATAVDRLSDAVFAYWDATRAGQ